MSCFCFRVDLYIYTYIPANFITSALLTSEEHLVNIYNLQCGVLFIHKSF